LQISLRAEDHCRVPPALYFLPLPFFFPSSSPMTSPSVERASVDCFPFVEGFLQLLHFFEENEIRSFFFLYGVRAPQSLFCNPVPSFPGSNFLPETFFVFPSIRTLPFLLEFCPSSLTPIEPLGILTIGPSFASPLPPTVLSLSSLSSDRV